MRAIFFSILTSVIFLTACNDQNKSSNTTVAKDSVTTSPPTANAGTPAISTNDMVNAYLGLKNALANDNGNDAANAGKQLSEVLPKVDEAAFTTDQKKVYDDVKDDIKEHAEHISANAADIAHQREHFDMLSKDMYALVKTFKPSQTLYNDHCPMYNEGKGATWLSETKEIKNPYLGKKMPGCGSVKEEINK